jgi:hypothetical protein
MMNDYMAPDWQRIFAFNGLQSFDDFWKLEAKWFEEPNQRRGGWSGVARCDLRLPEGGVRSVFLKRQENHTTRTLGHPLRGIPTFVREFQQMLRYRQHAIPSLTPLYFAFHRVEGNLRAVLITEELTGFRSLDEVAREWKTIGRKQRHAIIEAVAALLRQIHGHKLTHNCFYPKHVFVRPVGDKVEARVIDLEKTKWHLFGSDRNFRDMRRLNTATWSRAERVHFFRRYLGVERLTPEAKQKWRQIARRHLEKRPEDAVLFKKTAVAN